MQVQLMVALKFIREGNSMKKARGNKNSKEIKEKDIFIDKSTYNEL